VSLSNRGPSLRPKKAIHCWYDDVGFKREKKQKVECYIMILSSH
jgi:hypothetical protein